MELLVSPSSLEEARNSLAADIIDVKRPAEGSLGANFPWVIKEIKKLAGDKPVSAAIGDYDYKPGNASLSALGAAYAGADYIKLGLMFSGKDRVFEVIKSMTRAVKDEFPEKYVVFAAYADYQRLGSISPMDISELVAEGGADIAMVDTGIKDGKTAFEFMNEEELTAFTQQNRDNGIRTALAGSLRFEDIECLKRIDPEIIGVRGMVCGGDRSATVREDLVLKAIELLR